MASSGVRRNFRNRWALSCTSFGVAGTWELEQEECGRDGDGRGRRAPSSEVARGARRRTAPRRESPAAAPAPAVGGVRAGVTDRARESLPSFI